jgi:hypothetical protein
MPARGGSRVELELTPAMRAELFAVCAEENAVLARDYGLDLARHGYLMPAGAPAPDPACESSQPASAISPEPHLSAQ